MRRRRTGMASTKAEKGPPIILVVEDDEALASLVQRRLRRAGFHTEIFLRGAEVVDWLTKNYATLLLLDYSLPDMTGKEVAEALHERQCGVPFIVCTGRGDENIAVSMMKLGARDYLVKDGTFLDRLPQAVRLAIQGVETERKLAEAEKALRKSEAEYRCVFENNATATVIIDEDMTVVMANPEFEKLSGFERREIEGRKSWGDFVFKTDLETLKRNHFRKGGDLEAGPRRLEFRFLDKQGNVSDVFVRVGMLPGGKRFIASLVDISSWKQARKELQESEERFRILVEDSPLGIALFTGDGTYKYVNPRFTEMFGYTLQDIPTRKEWLVKAYPDPRARNQVISSWSVDLEHSRFGESRKRLMNVRCKDGSGRVIHATPVSMRGGDQFVIYEDLTEQKSLENLLVQAQRMEAMGTLAGGIAHDFNNILSALLGNAELALDLVHEKSQAGYCINQVLKAGNRAADLVRQILAFSRQAEMEKRPVKIGPVIKEVLRFLRASLPKNIEIRQRINTRKDTVLAEPTQIHQVLMNLCTNAHHALCAKGGILEVKLDHVVLDKAEVTNDPDMKTGPYVRLTVKDTGQGIEREILERIFDPYFTTKGKGMGTGLGLAVVHGIVKDHGGAITVRSETGVGTRFEVFFPFFEAGTNSAGEESEPISRGTERVLFVDDEETLADLGKRMMEHLGYEVSAVTDSFEALKNFKDKPQGFDLIITDMTMPKMTGDVLAQEVMKTRPDIPIILCTGFHEAMSEDRAKEIGIKALVMKPFVMRDMARTIRQALKG